MPESSKVNSGTCAACFRGFVLTCNAGEDGSGDEGVAPSTSEDTTSGSKRKREASPQRKRKSGKKRRKEYGMSRGVDFVDVACVVNFDFPRSPNDYTHRVGRTARAGRSGMALSFVVTEDKLEPEKTTPYEGIIHEGAVFKRVAEDQGARGSKLKEYVFDPKQIEAFRYRTSDALRAVTKNSIKEARLKELKQELLNSDKLKVSRITVYRMRPPDL